MRTVYLLVFFTLLFACQPNKTEAPGKGFPIEPQVTRDWEQIAEDGVLKVITMYSSTSYFIYRGRPMGFEYELLSRLADDWDLELDIIIARTLDEVFGLLNRGEADMVAYGLTVTRERKQYVSFTVPYLTTHQVLVQRKPDNWRQMKLHEIEQQLIADPLQLIGDTVSVRKNSSYHHRLMNLSQEMGDDIVLDTVPPELSTDEIIRKVANGELKYTVADYNIAAMSQSYHPNLHIDLALSLSQRIAWAVRKNSPELQEKLNEWIKNIRKTIDYHVIYNRYFKSKKSYARRLKSEFFSGNTGQISPYDSLVKRYNDSILEWDWRILVSQMYQESHFDPQAQSWVGARGLMQLMPGTARDLGVTRITDPEQNIRAGVRYIKQLWEMWPDIPDTTQRIKVVLASYNCGVFHVKDAQKLAVKYDKQATQWDDGLDEFILKLASPNYYNDEVVKYGYTRGSEPYRYVSEIMERYKHYKQFIAEHEGDGETAPATTNTR